MTRCVRRLVILLVLAGAVWARSVAAPTLQSGRPKRSRRSRRCTRWRIRRRSSRTANRPRRGDDSRCHSLSKKAGGRAAVQMGVAPRWCRQAFACCDPIGLRSGE